MKELQLTRDRLDKDYLASISSSIIERVKEGEYSALDAYIQLKAYEKVIKDTLGNIQHDAIEEAEMYHKEERIKFGVEFSLTNGRANYDFDADPEYSQLNEALKKRKSLLTDAAKAVLKGSRIVDENGAIVEPPPMKESSKAEGIVITFK